MTRLIPGYQFRVMLALGLLSGAVIGFQLVLMQLISFMQWYHFAYMIISIAMLGFGAAGTTLAIFRNKMLASFSWLVPLCMILSGIFMIISFMLARLSVFQFDVYLLFVDRTQLFILAVNYLIYFIPFYLAALPIGLILTRYADSIGSYYFSNLLGSGLGGLLAVIILGFLFAIEALPVVSILAVMAGLLAFHEGQRSWWVIVSIVFSVFIISLFWVFPGTVPMSQYKSMARTLLLPDADKVISKPDIYGRIDVVSSPALRYAPALSFSFLGEVPVKKHVYANGEFYGVVPRPGGMENNIHDFTTDALPYVLGERETVLIPNAATGAALAHALHNGAQRVVSVTDVSTVKTLMEQDLAASSYDLFLHDRAEVYFADSRQALFRFSDTSFDAIILPRMESFGGSTGLNAIAENYLLTLEAFNQMWNMLSPDGVISVSTWIDYPPRTTLKLLATLVQTLKNNGIDNPEYHFAAIRSWGTITFVVQKNALSSMQQKGVRQFSNEMMFDLLFLPDLQPHEREVFNFLDEEDFFDKLDAVMKTDDAFFQSYSFYIQPASDNKPYFGRFIKPQRIREVLGEFGSETFPFLELGYLIVWVTLAQGAVLAMLFIILPLFSLRRRSTGKGYTIIYFGCLGLGYMFVEIILIQRFILYFGHALYAVAAVISTMMVASGLGSLVSAKWGLPGHVARRSTLIITALLLLYTAALTPLLLYTIHFSVFLKIPIAFLLLFIPSFFMGMPFPSGIGALGSKRTDQIPWAWGINGSLSVIATALATLTAVEAGFKTVMILAALFYLIAYGVSITGFRHWSKE